MKKEAIEKLDEIDDRISHLQDMYLIYRSNAVMFHSVLDTISEACEVNKMKATDSAIRRFQKIRLLYC